MGQKTVVITGTRGQFASYAADKYLADGWRVIGVDRRSSSPDFTNVRHNFVNPNFIVQEADITDSSSIVNILTKFKPDLWLNAAAQSHVGSSYNQPIVTAEINYLGVAKILEAIRQVKPDTKFWQASTSERFGNATDIQTPDTAPSPISPYAVSKVASEYLIKAYRETYDLYACYSIMFNYESPRRSKAFVTRKITDYIGRTFNTIEREVIDKVTDSRVITGQEAYDYVIKEQIIPHLYLGNIDSRRSWTHCKDIVDGVYLQMQQDKPQDFIFGLEETHSVREFLDCAFSCVGVHNWSDIVMTDQTLFRPSDVKCLRPSMLETKKVLGWEPKYSFEEIVTEMINHDIYVNSK
jgi:GDPmannose 4,6-dehydratase